MALCLEAKALQAADLIRDLEGKMERIEAEKKVLGEECERLRAALLPYKSVVDRATSPAQGAASYGGEALSATGVSSRVEEEEDTSVCLPVNGGWTEAQGRRMKRKREGDGPAVSAKAGAGPPPSKKSGGSTSGGSVRRRAAVREGVLFRPLPRHRLRRFARSARRLERKKVILNIIHFAFQNNKCLL